MRVRRHTGAVETWSWGLPQGPASRVSPTTAHDGRAPLPEGTRVEGVSIELEVQAPLGDRGHAALIARDEGGGQVTLEVLPPPGPMPRLGPVWVVDRFAIVAVDRPRGSRSLHVVDVHRARALLLDQGALARLARASRDPGALAEAIGLWQRARAADPTFGDAAYNLACAYARAGAPTLAQQHLAQAIAIDGPRYRLLARLDPDLAAVRTASISVDPLPSSR